MTPRQKLAKWARTHDLSVMGMEEMLRAILRCGLECSIDTGESGSISSVWQHGTLDFCEGESKSPSTAVRRAIRAACKGVEW